MKKQLIFAAVVLALAACGNDESLNPNDGPVEIRLSSGIEVQETTRAATDIQESAFDANELVDVYINEYTQGQATTIYDSPLTYTTGASNAMNPPTGQQPYFPTSGNGVTIYAVYPSASETFAEGGYSNGTFTIQKDQSTNNTSGDKNYKLSDLMYGTANNGAEVPRTSNNVVINFSHLLSKVTVNLKAGSGLDDTNLNNAVVSLLGLQPTIGFTTETGELGNVSGETTEITVMNATSTLLSGSAIIVPQSLAISTPFIKIHLAEGGDLYYNLAKPATFQSGMVYIYDITVNLTGLTVTSNIEPWDTEGEGGYTGDNGGSATMR